MGIIVYTLPNCPKCHILTRYLTLMHVEFEERDAQDCSDMLIRLGFYAAPVLEIDGEFFNFTTVDILRLILRKKGYLRE